MNARRAPLWIPILLCLGNLPPAVAQTRPAQRGVVDSTSRSSTPPSPGPYYALLVGIDNYHDLPVLKTAVSDADAVAALLHNQYDFKTQVLHDATRDQIMSALSDYRRMLSENSNLLIYYAGHGYYDRDTDRAYWLPVDAKKDNNANWIIADEITSDARAVPARHVLVISDSCYSGALNRDARMDITPLERGRYLQQILQAKSRNLMSSGGNEPVADGGAPGHSVFGAALLAGLSRMNMDAFTANELFSQFVQQRVAGGSLQVPQYGVIRDSGHEDGDFVFTRHAAGGPGSVSTGEVGARVPAVPATSSPAVSTRNARSAVADPFEGSWVNVDKNTRGVTKAEIRAVGGHLVVQLWGRCHPTDCDWGMVPLEGAGTVRHAQFHSPVRTEELAMTPPTSNAPQTLRIATPNTKSGNQGGGSSQVDVMEKHVGAQ